MLLPLVLVLAAAQPEQPNTPDWQKGLELPISPASVALLVGHAREERVRGRWSEALGHPEPNVRATTARVLEISGVVGLRDQLLAALSREADEAVGAELVRAAVVMGAPPDNPTLRSAAERPGAPARAYFTTLAWT